ncbi:MAG: aconitase X swivel domain-containing protein [Candidatus Methylopumilus sp.]
MSQNIFTAKHAQGPVVEGVCLTAQDGFSARYDLDRINGVFSRPSHPLYGKPYHNTILVVDTDKGGVASAWMIYEMKMRNLCPLAIVFNTVNPILAQGAAHGGIAMLAGFEVDITTAIPSGSTLRINPAMKTLEIITPAS